MQFALMIYHTPEEFDMRKNDYSDPHLGAWRAYYRALADAGVYVGADALEVPETGTTVRIGRSEEHTSELQSRENLVCRLLLEKKNKNEIFAPASPTNRCYSSFFACHFHRVRFYNVYS